MENGENKESTKMSEVLFNLKRTGNDYRINKDKKAK